MKASLYSALIILICWAGINNNNLSAGAEKEIEAAEIAFAKAAAEKGVKPAFLEFADDSAVISRGGRIYHGKNGIAEFYGKQTLQNVSLTWKPDFVKAAQSGEMGYTYGKYHFSAQDSTGKKIESDGIFHTVWQKQKNGSWKFIYD
jgi:ketosteroid isomerase-like protein